MTSFTGKPVRSLRGKNGAALAMVILLLLLLSITVVTFLSISLFENRTEIYQNRRTQAYYLAWSGANSVGDWIIKHSASSFSLDGKTAVNTDNFSNGDVEVNVEIDSDSGQLLVKAIGDVSGIKNTATLRLQQVSTDLMLDKAIYSNTALDISGMNVSGDVQSGDNISYSTNGSNAFTGVAYPNALRHYQLAAFPTTLPLFDGTGILSLKNATRTISGTGYRFYSIDIENSAELILEPTNVMQMVVDDMIIDSSMTINGSGRVELFINNSLTITTKGVINNLEPYQLVIYLKAGSTFYMQANKVLNAYVIGPDATMEIQSAQSITNGALITNVIRKNAQGNGPNGMVNWVPPPDDFDIEDILISFEVLRWE